MSMEVNENTTPQDVYNFVKANLPKSTDLAYVHYDENLDEDQVQGLLHSQSSHDGIVDDINEAYSDGVYDAAEREVKDIVGEDAYTILEEDDDLCREARYAIEETDESTPVKDLLRNTRSMLLRYRMRDDWADWPVPSDSWRWTDEEMEENAKALATTFGLPFDEYREQMVQLLANASYGGSPEIIFYDDVDRWVKAATKAEWQPDGSTITFEDPMLLVIDNMNGSGHDVRIKGSITVPYVPERIVVDGAKGNGYGWDSIAGVYKPAYKTSITFNAPQEVAK